MTCQLSSIPGSFFRKRSAYRADTEMQLMDSELQSSRLSTLSNLLQSRPETD